MISLLLTLFISMLSIGSSINTIDGFRESRVSTFSTINSESLNLQDSKSINNAFVVNGYDMYIGLSEFGDYNYYRSFLDNLKQYNTIYNTNITFSQFVAGTPLDVNVAFKAGNMDNGAFAYSWDINRLKVTLDTSRTQEDRITWEFFEAGGAKFNIESRYVYYDGLKLDCIMNNTRIINGSATTGWMNLCFVYNIYDYRTLLPTNYNDMSYSQGYDTGYYDGYATGYDSGYNYGNNVGYQNGVNDTLAGIDYDHTALTIFSGIMGIALVPINMFLQIFNFEILGINLSGFISGILTVAVVVIIIRMITGGKKDD